MSFCECVIPFLVKYLPHIFFPFKSPQDVTVALLLLIFMSKITNIPGSHLVSEKKTGTFSTAHFPPCLLIFQISPPALFYVMKRYTAFESQ